MSLKIILSLFYSKSLKHIKFYCLVLKTYNHAIQKWDQQAMYGYLNLAKIE